MKQRMKTVSEVCALTGLSRKQLFDYEDTVPPSDRYGHNSQGKGYKLYDNKAIIKLYQVAIFRDLGITRKKIKEYLTAKDYDANKILETQISILEEQKRKTERLIAGTQELLTIGINDMVCETEKRISMADLGRWIEVWKRDGLYDKVEDFINGKIASAPEENKQFENLLKKFLTVKEEELNDHRVENILDQLLESGMKALHACSIPVLVSIGESIQCGGKTAEILRKNYETQFGTTHGKKLISYLDYRMKERLDRFIDEITETLADYEACILSACPEEFSSPKIRSMTQKIKAICKKYFGIEENCEYEIGFDALEKMLKLDKDTMRELGADPELSQVCEYVIGAVKYYMKDSDELQISRKTEMESKKRRANQSAEN